MNNTIDWQYQFETISNLQTQQQYTEAESRCRKLLAELPFGSEGLLIQARLLGQLINCLESQARYSEAQALLQDAQVTLDEVKAICSDEVYLPLELELLSQQGTLARIQGHYAQAEAILQQGIQLATTYGFHHQALGMTFLNNLAIVYKYWGRFDEAEVIYQSLLDDFIQQHGTYHLEVATIYHNLAGLHHAQRDYRTAEPYARISYQLHIELLGIQHPQTIADGAALASILHGLKQWDEAIAHFEAAIAFFEKQFGSVHYEIAINLNNLAASLQAKGDVEQAEKAYRRALEIKEALLGSVHPDVAISLNNLASLLHQTDKQIEAAELFKRAIAIFDATVGPEHPNTLTCRENAGQV